jgi:hypothetical protein
MPPSETVIPTPPLPVTRLFTIVRREKKAAIPSEGPFKIERFSTRPASVYANRSAANWGALTTP